MTQLKAPLPEQAAALLFSVEPFSQMEESNKPQIVKRLRKIYTAFDRAYCQKRILSSKQIKNQPDKTELGSLSSIDVGEK